MTYSQLEVMMSKAETGEQFAEICRLEDEMLKAQAQERNVHPACLCGCQYTEHKGYQPCQGFCDAVKS